MGPLVINRAKGGLHSYTGQSPVGAHFEEEQRPPAHGRRRPYSRELADGINWISFRYTLAPVLLIHPTPAMSTPPSSTPFAWVDLKTLSIFLDGRLCLSKPPLSPFNSILFTVLTSFQGPYALRFLELPLRQKGWVFHI